MPSTIEYGARVGICRHFIEFDDGVHMVEITCRIVGAGELNDYSHTRSFRTWPDAVQYVTTFFDVRYEAAFFWQKIIS